MTIDTSREAVERLLDGVTPGPWAWEENHPTNACASVTAKSDAWRTIDIATLYGTSDCVPAPTMPDEPWGDHPIRRANANFIAAARELVPALLARAEAAEAREQALLTSYDEERKALVENASLRERLKAARSERDAAIAEVARLSAPPDDAEVDSHSDSKVVE